MDCRNIFKVRNEQHTKAGTEAFSKKNPKGRDVSGWLIADVPCVILSLQSVINTRHDSYCNLYSAAKRFAVKSVFIRK